jgi:hypothetical protein
MSNVDLKTTTPPVYTPAPGSTPTEETVKTGKTEAGKGTGASGTAGNLPPAEGSKGGKSVPPGVGDGGDELQFTDSDLQTFYGVDDSRWDEIRPRDKEALMKAMIEFANRAAKQQTDSIVLSAQTAMTENLAQAGELNKAAEKTLTQGIVMLAGSLALGGISAGMQGMSAFKLAKSSAGETLKTFNGQLKEMNAKATAAGQQMKGQITEMSAEMTKLSDKAANGTLTKVDIQNFKDKYGPTLDAVVGPESSKVFTDKLNAAVDNGLGFAAKDVAKEAFQDVQRQTTKGTDKAVKKAKSDARTEFMTNNPVMEQTTKQMEFYTAPIKKYDAIGAIAGAGEKTVTAGGTIAASEAQAAQADASSKQAGAAQATASRDVVLTEKQQTDAFIQKIIDALNTFAQTEVDMMGTVTRGGK